MSSSKPEAKHEPLTNAELVILANREYDVEHIGERAAATIRDLRAALRKYGEHLSTCPIRANKGWGRMPSMCDCGFTDAKKEPDDE